MLSSWLVGWLPIKLVGWLDTYQVGCLVGYLSSWLVVWIPIKLVGSLSKLVTYQVDVNTIKLVGWFYI